jgi:NAD(P)-dependent dehydrogenase (short-subunit alcohol dehydrogenase family)
VDTILSGAFYVARAALRRLPPGSSLVAITSVRRSPQPRFRLLRVNAAYSLPDSHLTGADVSERPFTRP